MFFKPIAPKLEEIPMEESDITNFYKSSSTKPIVPKLEEILMEESDITNFYKSSSSDVFILTLDANPISVHSK